MKCEICGKPSGKRKTCSPKCRSALMSKLATERRKSGIGWGRGSLNLGKSKNLSLNVERFG